MTLFQVFIRTFHQDPLHKINSVNLTPRSNWLLLWIHIAQDLVNTSIYALRNHMPSQPATTLYLFNVENWSHLDVRS